MPPRSDPRLMAQALHDKKDGARKREDFEAFFSIILELREFFEYTKSELFDARNRVEAEGQPSPEALIQQLGINPMVHYARYNSDTQNLVHVLNKPTECAIWGRFCQYAAEDPTKSAVVFFTLKGGINLVITNVPLIIPPGVVHHVIKSGSGDIRDVVIFRAEHAPKFFHQHFMKG